MPLAGLIDIEQEIAKQNKKFLKLDGEKKSLEARINNERFMQSAPEALVSQTKARIEEINVEQANIKELIEKLG